MLFLLLGSYDVAHRYVYCSVTFAPHFGRKAQCAQLPAYHAENVEPQAVVAVEIYRYHRHVELLDESYDRRLPFAVLDAQLAVDFAYGSGGEESDGISAAYLHYGFLDAFHRHGFLGRIVRRKRVNGYEVGPHCRYVVKHHVHHHFKRGAYRTHHCYERYSVESAKRVVAYSDESSFGQVVEYFLSVDA